jgi:membrane-associated phospholipid phosphatase
VPPDLLSRVVARLPARWHGRTVALRSLVTANLVAGLVVCAALLWGFVSLADEVPEHGWLVRVDLAVAAWLQVHGTEGGESIFAAVSWLGSPVLIAVAVLMGAWLAVRRSWLRFGVWAGTIAGGAALELVLKAAFHRTRPVYAAEFIHRASWSFPSGHAMNSLIVYGLLAHVLLPHIESPAGRRALVAGAVVLIAAIGYSRLYLGVHYLSDVVAGFLAGGLWLLVCIGAYDLSQQRAKRVTLPQKS